MTVSKNEQYRLLEFALVGKLRGWVCWLGFAVSAGAMMIGCSQAEVSSNPGGALVGTIHVDGQPITSGTVIFYPRSGAPISREILEDASFTHVFSESGTYQVALQGEGIPAKYGDPESSGLVVEIDTASTEPIIVEYELGS